MRNPEEGDFIIVKVETLNSKREFHYVARVLSKTEGSVGDMTVDFYRQLSRFPDRFVKPVIDDISAINVDDIVTILPHPDTDDACTNRMKSF